MTPAALQAYLARVPASPVEVRALRRLGGAEPGADDPKGFGYGVPLEVECVVGECVMGILDSYPPGYPFLPEPARPFAPSSSPILAGIRTSPARAAPPSSAEAAR